MNPYEPNDPYAGAAHRRAAVPNEQETVDGIDSQKLSVKVEK